MHFAPVLSMKQTKVELSEAERAEAFNEIMRRHGVPHIKTSMPSEV